MSDYFDNRVGAIETLHSEQSVPRTDHRAIIDALAEAIASGRLRTGDRAANVTLPSLTPVWRSCDLQEREVFDLFGVVFEGHPDLRRLLMWDAFVGHPMRKDYVPPDDHDWEPTPHGEVLERAKAKQAAAPAETRP